MDGNAALARRPDSGRDDFNLLAAEDPLFTGMGIECRHGNARPGDAEGLIQAGVGQLESLLNIFAVETARHLSERNMAGHRDDAQLISDQHHTALGRAAKLAKQFGMTGIVIAGVDENVLADGRGGDGVSNTRKREFGSDANVAERTMPSNFSAHTGTGISRT